jgi:HD superfamily phosphohydrolase YqeK
MLSEAEIIEKLEKMVSERRFQHSLRVKDMSIELAKKYDVDIEKVKFAALFMIVQKATAVKNFSNCVMISMLKLTNMGNCISN